MSQGAFVVAGPLFQRCELPHDLAIGNMVRTGQACFLANPFRYGQLQHDASTKDIAFVLGIEAAEFEEDLVAVRIGAQAFAQKGFGLFDLVELLPQPIGRDGVGVHSLWVQGRSQPEPGENLSRLTEALKVAMLGRLKVAAKRFEPVAVPVMRMAAGVIVVMRLLRRLRQVGLADGSGGVEDGRVKTLMKIGVSFEENMVGKRPPALAEQESEHGTFVLPMGLLPQQQASPRREGHSQRECGKEQREGGHQLSGRRRKTHQAPNRKKAA